MSRRSALVLGLSALLLLTGCASAAGDGSAAPTSAPTATQSVPPARIDAAAEEQAQAWLDAAVVPPGAVRVTEKPVSFNSSYQGWPCQPVAQLEGYWTLADTTVAGAANWLQENPTADLVSTASGSPWAEDPNLDGATIGYIPADDSQQGVVYTVVKTDSGVAIRAEVAALSASASCPSLPPGEMLGKPGQG
ncbi:hypothetical protein RN51_02651 [Microbacterium oxydans]|uniref:Lipoprotein n=1 Tax=Microbacterium oxydans TaxID=82380 RepID=A0A0F0KJ15_9MICO|nr:hypothetical protein [Microbacterium oxydans]KJL20434.1 hypothetical protein RN51_02651 [Microbacterium oxydans]